MKVAPPARNSAAMSIRSRPARAAASSSRMALSLASFGKSARGGTRREAFHERRAELAGDEVLVRKNLQMHRNARLDAVDDGHLEHALHPRDGFLPVASV